MEKIVCCGQRQSLSCTAFNLGSLWAWIPASIISSCDSQLADPILFSNGPRHTCVLHVCHICQISLHLALGNLPCDEQMFKTPPKKYLEKKKKKK